MNSYSFPFIRLLGDAVVIFMSALLVNYFLADRYVLSNDNLRFVIESSASFVFISLLVGRYNDALEKNVLRNISEMLLAWMVSIITIIVINNTYRKELNGILNWEASFFFITPVSLVIWIYAHRILRKYFSLYVYGAKKVVLIHHGQREKLNLLDVKRQQKYGYIVKETFSLAEKTIDDRKISLNLTSIISENQIDEVWICLGLSQGNYIQKIIYALRHSTVEIRYIPKLDDLKLLNHKASNIAGHYAIDLSCSPLSGTNRYLKRFIDLGLTISLLPLLIPVCMILMITVKLASPGPALFKQERHGISGSPIKVYKFRTMSVEATRSTDVRQAKQDDARITGIGRILRKTSLDELPQFFNVLQGRMSIVGPRPHALEHNEYYKDLVDSYMWRHKVKPGITGWAQVNGLRGETDTVEKMEARVKADFWYIENWSIWLDIKIIILTVFKGFINKNAY